MMIYPTRYQAEKARRKGEEVVVKVFGGYAVMTYRDYQIWKGQK
jgi:hypothetical protein